jgi:hypothetical protein
MACSIATAGYQERQREMNLQQFGNIETEQGFAGAMLCMDRDRPAEAMIHWFGEGMAARALLCNLEWRGDILNVTPSALYYTTEGGALYCPRSLNDEERIAVRTTRGRLHNSNGGLEGEWTNEAGKSGHIKFAPLPTSSAQQPALNAAQCATWEEFKV